MPLRIPILMALVMAIPAQGASLLEGDYFYKVTIVRAAAGKAEDLLKQRRMEKVYLAAEGQKPNMIFRRAGGSDVDLFTIGFHQSLETFAAQAQVTDEEKEAAVKVK